jgi:putative endonuclease
MLVWYEPHEVMTEAIRRELATKHWRRVWKLELIERMNPEWRDLYPDFA